MAVWTCNTFLGMWPVPTAAVVVADSEAEAWAALDAKLRKIGLDGLKDFDKLEPIDVNAAGVFILSDGNY